MNLLYVLLPKTSIVWILFTEKTKKKKKTI